MLAGPRFAEAIHMSFRRATAPQTESIAPLAEALADALAASGATDASREVLAIAAARSPDAALAMRRADAALKRGDAATALHALVPAWEAGSQDPRLEAMLALCALALRLDDVARQLCERRTDVEHASVRLLLALATGEGIEFDPTRSWSELLFSARTQLRVLASCGRSDIVWAAQRRANDIGVPGFARIAARLRATPPPRREAHRPAAGGRAAFVDAWRWPASTAMYSWAWSAARDVLTDDRVLLVGPQPQPFRPLLEHARVTTIGGTAGDGVDALAVPESLPVAPSRFDHAIVAFWLRESEDPRRAIDQLTLTLAHDGLLHLAAVGSEAPGRHDLTLSLGATVRACAAAGLEVLGADARAADGAPGDTIHLVRARRRLV